jgi:ABC-2 type transport system permease protein
VIALVRTEFTKAARRVRTLIVVVLLIGLPALIVTAIHAHGNHPDQGGSGGPADGLFRLARESGLIVPAAVLTALSGFLLVVIAGTFAGDSVAGDSGWGNLRYLLMRPVARGKLLVAKAFVAGTLIWAATIIAALAGLVAGIMLFGAHPVPLARVHIVDNRVVGLLDVRRLSQTVLLERTAIATAYVAFGYSALLALGTLFSTLTDSAASAIGATIGVYIVSEILDAITALGRVRYAFPTHYLGSWTPMFTDNRYPHDMLVGIVLQVVYVVVAGAAALIVFHRKDIRS